MLTISAPGYESVTLEVTIGVAGDVQTVAVPALRAQPAESKVEAPTATPAAASTEPTSDTGLTPETDGSGRRLTGFIVGGAGIAVLGVGATFGVLALSAYGDADKSCPLHTDCGSDTKEFPDKANLRATIANVAVPVGLVGAAGGRSWCSPRARAPSGTEARAAARFIPSIGPSSAGIEYSGVF